MKSWEEMSNRERAEQTYRDLRKGKSEENRGQEKQHL